jgi:uncharacterized protein (DUF433 family)
MTARPRTSATIEDPEVYRYLERRPHRWRKQLYLKGRNMTVAHLVYDMRANRLTPEEAAEDFELPLEQVEEALRYYERHRDVVERDQDEERRRLESKGYAIDPPPLPR